MTEMSAHKTPLTPTEEAGLRAHGMNVGTPSQLSDAFRQGVTWGQQSVHQAQSAETRYIPEIGDGPAGYYGPDTHAPQSTADALELRKMLAVVYCGTMLYSDDGELQDNTVYPFIDFKRDSVERIQAAMQSRAITQAEGK